MGMTAGTIGEFSSRVNSGFRERFSSELQQRKKDLYSPLPPLWSQRLATSPVIWFFILFYCAFLVAAFISHSPSRELRWCTWLLALNIMLRTILWGRSKWERRAGPRLPGEFYGSGRTSAWVSRVSVQDFSWQIFNVWLSNIAQVWYIC